jgi:hypothetical protein
MSCLLGIEALGAVDFLGLPELEVVHAETDTPGNGRTDNSMEFDFGSIEVRI